MTDTDRMVVWLREAMDAAQADAEAATPGPWRVRPEPDAGENWEIATTGRDQRWVIGAEGGGGVYDKPDADHIARHDPAAVLRRIAADRKLLELHTTPHTVVELAVEPVGESFCVECNGPCTHKGEAECVICGQDGCDTMRLLAEAWGWTEEEQR